MITLRVKKWLLGTLIVIPVFFLVLYLAVWGMSPVTTRFFMSDFLERHHVQLKDSSSIRYNPFSSYLSIRDFVIADEHQVYFRIDTLDAEVDLHEALNGDIVLTKFLLDGVFFKGKKTADDLIIAGMSLSELTGTQEPVKEDEADDAEKGALPYRVHVPEILIKNITIDFDNEKDNNLVTLEQLTLRDILYQEIDESKPLAHNPITNSSTKNSSISDGSTQGNVAEGNVTQAPQKISRQLSLGSAELVLKDIQANQQAVKLTAKKYQLALKDISLYLTSENASIEPVIYLSATLSTALTALNITNNNENYLRVDSVNAAFDLRELDEDGIVLNEFLIDGVFFKGKQTSDELIVAGIRIPKTDDTNKNNTSVSVDPANQEPSIDNRSAFPYRVHVPKILVTNIDVDFENNTDSNLLTLEKLLIENMTYKDVDKSEMVENNLLKVISSQLSAETIDLILANINVNQEALNITAKKYQLTSQDMALTLETDGVSTDPIIDFSSILATSLSSLNITNEGKDNVVLRLADLNLPKIDTTYNKNVLVGIPSIELSELGFSEKLDAEGKPSTSLVTLKAVKLTNVQLTETSAIIDTFSLNTLASNVIIAADKSIATLVAMPGAQTETVATDENEDATKDASVDVAQNDTLGESTSKAKKEQGKTKNKKDKNSKTVKKSSKKATAKTAAVEGASSEGDIVNESTKKTEDEDFFIALNALTLVDGAIILFNDKSVSPNYKRTFLIDTLDAGPFDNQKPTQKSAFNLIGRSDEYSSFDVSGDITPFSEKLNLDTRVKLRELSLPDTSAYVKSILGFELKTGQLDTDIDVAVVEDNIKGNVRIGLRGLNMKAANDYQAGSLKDKTAMPLNVALGLLQDKKGNIDLKVPLSGNIDDPSFGLNGFMKLIIKKAVLSATQSYLINTFVPYANVVTVVKSSGEYILKLRFEDLKYGVGIVELQPDQLAYVDQFVTLLKDKPKEQVKVCGIGTPEEIGLPQGTKVTDEAQIAQIQKIAIDRAKLFKDHVVAAGVSSSRLLLCNAQIDSKKTGVPRITLAI